MSGFLIPPDELLRRYCEGFFPMSDDNGRMRWFSPDPRGIIPLDTFHIPHGLKRTLKQNPFEVRINTAFEKVLRGCADRDQTWIDASIKRSYMALFEEGHAHSVETWLSGALVGGLYGVSIGGAFFGESMFSYVSNASKVALVYLVRQLNERNFQLLDTQWTTEHLETFGAKNIPRTEYLERLREALSISTTFI